MDVREEERRAETSYRNKKEERKGHETRGGINKIRCS